MAGSSDAQTIAFYDREAREYSKSTTPAKVPRRLKSFAKRLPAGGTVLDLGCGGGWAAAEFQDLGLSATAMDASAAMIQQVKTIAGVQAIHGGFENLPQVGAFDGIWASFSLQHSPRDKMPDLLGSIAAALQPGGWLYIGIHEGNETLRDDLGRLYCHYKQEELRQMLLEHGLQTVTVDQDKSTSYDGRPIDCLHIEAQKFD